MGNCIFRSKSEAKKREQSGSKRKSNNIKHSSSDVAQKRDFFEKKGTASIKRKSPKTAEELWGRGKTTIAKEMATEEISKSKDMDRHIEKSQTRKKMTRRYLR